MRKPIIIISIILIIILVYGLYRVFTTIQPIILNLQNEATKSESTISFPISYNFSEEPKIKYIEILSGLSNPWDIVFIDNNQFIFSERNNKINIYLDGQVSLLHQPNDTIVGGEGGMLGLAIDPDFQVNRYIYACFNSNTNGSDIRVARWELNENLTSLENRKDIVSGIPANPSGRHSGCQIDFGPDNYLWIGTGDAAFESTPQDLNSLGGKILRVDRDGNSVAGNISNGDARIYSYGHRNTQGLLFLENNSEMLGYSIEHGSYRDDEINPLIPGNFGWDPGFGYNESVEMTDLIKFPNAVSASWSSGSRTIAVGGGTEIRGENWQLWQNKIAVSVLKDKKIIIFERDSFNNLKPIKEIATEYGRIRTVQQSPNGDLYFLTDNKNNDKIVSITTFD